MGGSRPFVLCVSGPSGSGKTSLCDRLAEQEDFAERSISITTRPQRPGEVSGKDYIFVSLKDFDDMRSKGDFLETAEVFGNWYGTPLQPVKAALEKQRIIVMDIDTVGARNVKKALGHSCVTVFVLPPSMDELERRLKQRKQNTPEDLSRRLQEATREIQEAKDYDYQITNSNFEQAYGDLLSLVMTERGR